MAIKIPQGSPAFLVSRRSIQSMARVEISVLNISLPLEGHQRFQSRKVYQVFVDVILNTYDSSYDRTKSYSVKMTSLLRNEEKYERSNKKCRLLQTIPQGESIIHLSYKTGYDCEVRQLTREGLGIEFEVTVVRKN